MQNPRETERELQRLREENERQRKRIKELEEDHRKLEEEKQKLAEQRKKLLDENKDLKEQLQRVLGSAPMLAASDKTAEAGGVPSSRVFWRRRVHNEGKRPTGGQPGHKGHARRRPEPNTPPLAITLDECPDCGTKLDDPLPNDALKRTVTDIPPPQLLIYDVERERYWCRKCQKKVQGSVAWLTPNEQFGPNVQAYVAMLRMQGLSMGKIQFLLRETYGLEVSEAKILDWEARLAAALGPVYKELESLVKQADVVGGDETKFRVGGGNGWLWVFEFLTGVLYVLAPTRSSAVPTKTLEGFKGTLVRDAWDPYDKVTTAAAQQLDVLHVNRWVERVEVQRGIEPRPLVEKRKPKFTRPGRPPREFLRFADGVRSRFREAILFVESEPSVKERERMHAKYQRSMRRFLSKPWKDKDAARIAKELRSREDQLFTFVLDPKVPWHNNGAERAIRQGVFHRKVSGGRRTWEGAQRFQVLLSVYETCKRTGENFLEKVKALAMEEAARKGSNSRGLPQT